MTPLNTFYTLKFKMMNTIRIQSYMESVSAMEYIFYSNTII